MTRLARVHTLPTKAEDKASNVPGGERQHAEIAEALSDFLASTYVLYQKSLFYHWNVRGENFYGLHKLFEEHYQALHEAGDVVAERLRALGHFAPGTLRDFIDMSAVQEDKKLPASSQQMVANLIESHEVCSVEAREVLDIADRAKDQVTVDLMTQRMAFHDKAAWMLRSISSKSPL